MLAEGAMSPPADCVLECLYVFGPGVSGGEPGRSDSELSTDRLSVSVPLSSWELISSPSPSSSESPSSGADCRKSEKDIIR
jgi:hypothetical protein